MVFIGLVTNTWAHLEYRWCKSSVNHSLLDDAFIPLNGKYGLFFAFSRSLVACRFSQVVVARNIFRGIHCFINWKVLITRLTHYVVGCAVFCRQHFFFISTILANSLSRTMGMEKNIYIQIYSPEWFRFLSGFYVWIVSFLSNKNISPSIFGNLFYALLLLLTSEKERSNAESSENIRVWEREREGEAAIARSKFSERNLSHVFSDKYL